MVGQADPARGWEYWSPPGAPIPAPRKAVQHDLVSSFPEFSIHLLVPWPISL